jgi:hypothetical protein
VECFTEILVIRFDQSKSRKDELQSKKSKVQRDSKIHYKKMEQYEDAKTNEEWIVDDILNRCIFLDKSWLNQLSSPMKKYVSTK